MVEFRRAELRLHGEGGAVQLLRRPEFLPRKLWAIMMWSQTVRLNMAGQILWAMDYGGRARCRLEDSVSRAGRQSNRGYNSHLRAVRECDAVQMPCRMVCRARGSGDWFRSA